MQVDRGINVSLSKCTRLMKGRVHGIKWKRTEYGLNMLSVLRSLEPF